jgi:hypothetical protein
MRDAVAESKRPDFIVNTPIHPKTHAVEQPSNDAWNRYGAAAKKQ